MKKVMTALFLLVGGLAYGQNSFGEIIGSVISSQNSEIIIGAKVWVEENDKKYQAYTDVEGKFRISAIPEGHYFLNVSYDEQIMDSIDIDVEADGYVKVGPTGVIKFGAQEMTVVVVKASVYNEMKIALNATPVFKLTAKDLVHCPVKFSIADMVSMMTSDVKKNDDGELMFRGSRGGDMLYLIDGVKTREIGAMPSAAINSMSVYTGGMPAKYGDTMGGVIVLETKSYFDLLKERGN